jgi:hypothetical protein
MRLILSFLFFTLLLNAFAQDSDFEERKYTKKKNFKKIITVEFNTAFGILDVESVTMAGLQTSYGVIWNDKFSLSGGTGIHLYESERFLPLFGEVRYTPGKGNTRILLGGSAGAYYAWQLKEWDRYINPFLGFTYQAFDHVHFTFSIGLVYKEYEVPNEPVRLPNGTISNVAGTREVLGRFFSVRFGCRF